MAIAPLQAPSSSLQLLSALKLFFLSRPFCVLWFGGLRVRGRVLRASLWALSLWAEPCLFSSSKLYNWIQKVGNSTKEDFERLEGIFRPCRFCDTSALVNSQGTCACTDEAPFGKSESRFASILPEEPTTADGQQRKEPTTVLVLLLSPGGSHHGGLSRGNCLCHPV